jgi:hypothetical protein
MLLLLLFKVFFTHKWIIIIFFLFFKNYFLYQRIKMIKKILKSINLKKSKILKIHIRSRSQIVPKSITAKINGSKFIIPI